MEDIVLRNKTEEGIPLEATFRPANGLSLVSFRKGNVEVMDTSVGSPGALIGPHYGDRNPALIPSNATSADPYRHGIARYAPWEVTSEASSLKGTLTGKQEWQGQPLAAWEGQSFTMGVQATLMPHGLTMIMSVVSDSDSVAGLECCFRLPKGQGRLYSDVKESYLNGKLPQPIPSEWNYNGQRQLAIDLAAKATGTFHPFFNPLEGHIHLDTSHYKLTMRYQCCNEENAWEFDSQPHANHVKIKAVSAKMPFRPCLTVSSLSVTLTID